MNHFDKNYVLKKQDAFVEVLLIDPITLPVARFFSELKFHPLSFTLIAFISRALAGLLFFKGILFIGAGFAFIGMFFDGVDGKVARIRKVDEKLHGVSDFLSDQVSVGIMVLGILSWGIKHYLFQLCLIIFLWIVLRLILMSVVSTWFRILSQEGIVYTEKVGEIFFREVSIKDQKFSLSVFGKLGRLFIFVGEKLKKYRLIPYLGAVESEFVLFILAPLFGMNIILVAIASVLLLPDIIIKLSQVFLRTLYSDELK